MTIPCLLLLTGSFNPQNYLQVNGKLTDCDRLLLHICSFYLS